MKMKLYTEKGPFAHARGPFRLNDLSPPPPLHDAPRSQAPAWERNEPQSSSFANLKLELQGCRRSQAGAWEREDQPLFRSCRSRGGLAPCGASPLRGEASKFDGSLLPAAAAAAVAAVAMPLLLPERVVQKVPCKGKEPRCYQHIRQSHVIPPIQAASLPGRS